MHSHRENPALPPSKHVVHMLAGEREPASPSACGSCRRARGRAPREVHVRQPPPCDKIRGFPTFRCFATRHDARKRRTDRLKSIARRRLADMRHAGPSERARAAEREPHAGARVLCEATRGPSERARAAGRKSHTGAHDRARAVEGANPHDRAQAARPHKKTRAEARVAWLL